MESYGEQENPQAILDVTTITIVFDDSEGRVSGSSGCNTYGGVYSINRNKITILEVSNTEIGCLEPEGILEQEEWYLRILPYVETFEIQNGKLRITAGNQMLIFGTNNDEG